MTISPSHFEQRTGGAWVQRVCWFFMGLHPEQKITTVSWSSNGQVSTWHASKMLQRRKTSLRMVKHFQSWEIRGVQNGLIYTKTNNNQTLEKTLFMILMFNTTTYYNLLFHVFLPCPYFIEPCWKAWRLSSNFCSTLSTQSAGICLSGPVFVPLRGEYLDGGIWGGIMANLLFNVVYIFSCTNLNIKELNIIVLYAQKIWNI